MNEQNHEQLTWLYEQSQGPRRDLIGWPVLSSNGIGRHEPRDRIRSLAPNYVLCRKSGIECKICFEELREGEMHLKTWCCCVQPMHISCVDRWLTFSGLCPFCCRARIQYGPILPIEGPAPVVNRSRRRKKRAGLFDRDLGSDKPLPLRINAQAKKMEPTATPCNCQDVIGDLLTPRRHRRFHEHIEIHREIDKIVSTQ